MKTILIGDIHGSFSQFDALLQRMELSVSQDRLILLGDLIDRGPDSYEVVQRVIHLKKHMDDRMVILRGSHERLFLNHANPKDALLWRAAGRNATIRSFTRNGEELSFYSKGMEQNTVLYYEDVFFQCAHAGVKEEPISLNDEYTLTMAHFLTRRNRYQGKLTITGHIHLKYPAYFDGQGGNPIRLRYGERLALPRRGVICLDTGCGNGGALTGMAIMGTEYLLDCAAFEGKKGNP